MRLLNVAQWALILTSLGGSPQIRAASDIMTYGVALGNCASMLSSQPALSQG